MVFSSSIFIFGFLPILLIAYAISFKINLKLSNIVLLLFSLFFILWGSKEDTIILVAMIVINFISGQLLTAGRKEKTLVKGEKRTGFQKLVLVLTLVLSLGILVYFKYASFLSANAENLLALLGISYQTPDFIKNIMLPLGISFYTFQALSYSLDVYFGNVGVQRRDGSWLRGSDQSQD